MIILNFLNYMILLNIYKMNQKFYTLILKIFKIKIFKNYNYNINIRVIINMYILILNFLKLIINIH